MDQNQNIFIGNSANIYVSTMLLKYFFNDIMLDQPRKYINELDKTVGIENIISSE